MLENLKNMTGYNEAKTEILEIVEDMGEATTYEIALITNRSHENAGILMLTYHRYGLLRRHKIAWGAYAYSITERGMERLDWLKSGDWRA